MNTIRITAFGDLVYATAHDSRRELEGVLLSHSTSPLVLNAEQENTRFYWSIEWGQRGHGGRIRFGLVAAGHGVTPQIHIFGNVPHLVIGVDSRVFGVHSDGTVIYNIELDGVFFEFLPVLECSLLLVIHELGVMALSPDGQVAWQHDTDVLTRWDIDGQHLSLQNADGESSKVALSTGRETRG